jgi:hypothetical protein
MRLPLICAGVSFLISSPAAIIYSQCETAFFTFQLNTLMLTASASYYTPQKLFTLALCFALVTASACARTNGKNYFPLADRAKWEYIGRSSSVTGKQLSVRATARVDGETLINGKRYFKYVLVSDFSSVPEIGKVIEAVRYYRVAEDGIYVRPGIDPDKQDLLEMPLPIPTGTKWLSGSTEVQAERVGTVKVGDREYRDCFKLTLKHSDGLRVTENYLAPDVGTIKSVFVNNTEPKSTVEITLEKYQP